MSTARKESCPICAYSVKLHNRRVTGGLMADGSVLWRFRKLRPDRTIGCNSIRLSQEAVAAMFAILKRLEKEHKEGPCRTR